MKKLVEIKRRGPSRSEIRLMEEEEFLNRVTAMERFVLTRLRRLKHYQIIRNWENRDELNELYETAVHAIKELCEKKE